MTGAPLRGRRIAIIGDSGSGKSALGRALSARLNIPHLELDALNFQPGWRALSVEEPERWVRAVADAIAGEAWITDGNYSQGALPQILPRVTDVIWLDYSRAVIMARVIRRSFARALSGKELWPGTGKREDFTLWLQKDHPIRWTWDTYRSANDVRAARFAGPELEHAEKYRFPTPREMQVWLDQLPGSRAALSRRDG